MRRINGWLFEDEKVLCCFIFHILILKLLAKGFWGFGVLIDDNKEYFANYIALGDEPKAAIIRTKNAVVVLNQTSEGIKSTLL
jgi:hypothetical protein